MDYTKGKWEVNTNEELNWKDNDGNMIVLIKCGDFFIDHDVKKDDAELIVSAVNACIEYDSENPLRFLEDAKKCIKVVKSINTGLLTFKEITEDAQKALEKKQ